MSTTDNNLAITNETGECPEGQSLRQISAQRGTFVGAAAVLQTSDGGRPYADTLAELGRRRTQSIGLRARFAGQEGETPLCFAIRRLG